MNAGNSSLICLLSACAEEQHSGFLLRLLAVRSPLARRTRMLVKTSDGIFYGEVLEWAAPGPRLLGGPLRDGGVAIRDAGSVAARIAPAGSMLSGERTSPRWTLYFPYRMLARRGWPPGMAAEPSAGWWRAITATALSCGPRGTVFGAESPRSPLIITAAVKLWPGAVSGRSPRAGRPGRAAIGARIRGIRAATALPADRSILKGPGNV